MSHSHNVFKLSGNMALGGLGSGGTSSYDNNTYSTKELESIKSSLRLLKARQSQKKKTSEYAYGGVTGYENQDGRHGSLNTGGSYSSKVHQRPQQIPQNHKKPKSYYEEKINQHLPHQISTGNNDHYGANQKYNNNQRVSNNNLKRDHDPMEMPLKGKSSLSTYEGKNSYDSVVGNNRNLRNDDGGNDGYENFHNNKAKGYRSNAKIDIPNNHNRNRNIIPAQQSTTKVSNITSNQILQSSYEEKPLKQINRSQNKPQIIEYDPSQFVRCSMGCGRKFNPESIQKHQAACLKVFQKKRKQFNAQEHRILDGQHKQLIKQADQYEKKGGGMPVGKGNKKGAGNGGSGNGKGNGKMNKWKAESLAFRAMLKQNKVNSGGGGLTAQEQAQLREAQSVGMVKCPHCGRSFNQNAGPKHIKFCETQSKKNKFLKK